MQPSTHIKTLGIIAGSRTLPILVATEARKAGVEKIAAVGFEGETDPKIEDYGVIAVQIHSGPPSEAWYKDIYVQELP